MLTSLILNVGFSPGDAYKSMQKDECLEFLTMHDFLLLPLRG